MKSIGIDISHTSEFKNFRNNKKFIEKIFTGAEIEYCTSKKDSHVHFAGKFALKEAFIKCMKGKAKIADIEILNYASGEPYVLWKGKRQNTKCSISHDKDIAISVCIA